MAAFSASVLPRLATTLSLRRGLRPSSLSTASRRSTASSARLLDRGRAELLANDWIPAAGSRPRRRRASRRSTFIRGVGDGVADVRRGRRARRVRRAGRGGVDPSPRARGTVRGGSSGLAAGAGFSATATVEAGPGPHELALSLVMKRTGSTGRRGSRRARRGLPRAATRAAGRALSAAIWEEATANIAANATARVLEARSPFADKPPSDADIDADWLVRIDADEIAPSGTSCAFSHLGTCRPLRVPKHFYRQRGAVPRAAGTSADTEMSTRLASVRAPATCAASAAPRRSASARTASTSTSASSRRVDRLTSRVGRESWVVSGRGARSAATRAAGDGPDDPSRTRPRARR